MFDVVWVKVWLLSYYSMDTLEFLQRMNEFEKESRKTNIMINGRG